MELESVQQKSGDEKNTLDSHDDDDADNRIIMDTFNDNVSSSDEDIKTLAQLKAEGKFANSSKFLFFFLFF